MDRTVPLQVRDLAFRYVDKARASNWGVNVATLQLAQGEQVLLTGRSGSGKSTLLYLIAGLLDPTRGSIIVGGTDIHSLHGRARDAYRGRGIGMIFQTFNLLSGFTALENVLAALMFSSIPGSEHDTRARSLLEQLGIKRFDDDVSELSVGQQQRVAVARAVVCDPVLVLADEPTASLDPENASAAMKLIQDLCEKKGAALLCASHDHSMAQRFDRKIDLEDLAGQPSSTEPLRA
ncbi:MAG TPA: ABC transporter ATP-binding protein [Planctomycetota bacterium]|nr:ABC transporter ATP-binding protein [Planctomycetota bacterium]